MKWTKAHSKAAVAVKRRLRIMRAEADPVATLGSVYKPRKLKPRFTVQIRDHKIGDSLTLTLHRSPWPNLWLCEHGQFSSAKIGRAVTLILGGGE